MQKYGKRLYLYRVDINYIKYLYNIDKEIYYNPYDENYDKKPYLGIIVSNNGYKYFIPLTSAKEKHKNFKNSSDNHIMIYENLLLEECMTVDISDWITKTITKEGIVYVKHILSILDIKKMIPVPDGVFFKENVDEISNSGRKRLLIKEHEFLSPLQDSILNKASKIYANQINSGKIFPHYCNFSLLEKAASEYNQ